VATFDNLHYAAAGSMCEPYISSDPVTKYFHDNLLMVSKKKKEIDKLQGEKNKHQEHCNSGMGVLNYHSIVDAPAPKALSPPWPKLGLLP